MIGLISAEIFKLQRRPMTWILGMIIVGLVSFVYASLLFVTMQGETSNVADFDVSDFEKMSTLENSVIFGFGFTHQIVTIMGIILMASAVTSEFSWRTINTISVWSGNRARLMLSKLITVSGFIFAGVILGFLASVLGGFLVEIARGSLSANGLNAGWVSNIFAGSGRTWLAVMVYPMLAAAISSITRSVAAGIAMSLAVLFLEPLGVPILEWLPGGFDRLTTLLFSTNVSELLRANGTIEGLEAGAPANALPLRAVLLLIIDIAALGFITIFAFVKRDIAV